MPPILIGGIGSGVLGVAARHADWWDVSSRGPQTYSRVAGEFERALGGHRDPLSVRRSWSGGCAVGRSLDQAQSYTHGLWSADADEDDFGFVGTPEMVVEQMRGLVAMGVSYFILDCGGFPDLTTLELLASEVLPALSE